MHIGLIGGCGPAATAYYYRGLTSACAAGGVQMELTIVHAQITTLMENMLNGSPVKQAQEFAVLGQRLKAAGAEQLAIPSLASHFCIPEFEPITPLPIINAVPELAAELSRNGYQRIGLLGTKVVMNSQLYGGLSAFEVRLPPGGLLEQAHQAYIGMAVAGYSTDQQRETLFSIGKDLCTKQGADIVVLGGTDLFLAFEGHDCGFPVLDAADVHIDAIYRVIRGAE